jgi:hypothetical protein
MDRNSNSVNHRVPDDGRIMFYARDRDAFAFLSNFYPSPFDLEGRQWATVEHYYQAQKADDPLEQENTRLADTPKRAKRLGRKACIRPDWNDVRVDVMRHAVLAKFDQNADLAELLVGTGDALLVEDSSFDFFWGAGECKGSVGIGHPARRG